MQFAVEKASHATFITPRRRLQSSPSEPPSRGAEHGSRIIIPHNNGCSGKQETNIESIPERLSWGTEGESQGWAGGREGRRREGSGGKTNKCVQQTRPSPCTAAASAHKAGCHRPPARAAREDTETLSGGIRDCWQRCSLPSSQGCPSARFPSLQR